MPDLLKCPCAGVTLNKLLRPAILAVLADGPMHGYRVAERIRRMPYSADQKPDISGIYRLLNAMQKEGLLTSSWDTPQAGSARKLYQTTPSGGECLHWWVNTLDSYRKRITVLLQTARRADRKTAGTKETRL